MFLQKLAFGAVAGGVLGLICAIVSLFQGSTLSEARDVLIGCTGLGILLTFWWTRDAEQSEHISGDDQVRQLQRQMRRNLEAAANLENTGDHYGAAALRSEAAVMESQLRQLGA